MPSCKQCGNYTKYNNGLCITCYKKKFPNSGWVYTGISVRPNGKKLVYTGMTVREPTVRWGEHMSQVKKENSKTWVGHGTFFKPLSAVWSRNAKKAEKTVKKMSPKEKIKFGIFGARKYSNLKK